MNLRYWLVMPAAGIGQRMQAERPKQYLPLCGKTVIEWSLQPFIDDPQCQGMIVALAPNDSFWPTLPVAHAQRVHTTQGGDQRAGSVLAGLQALSEFQASDDDWVLVHDAARPCLSSDDVDALLRATEDEQVGALLATPVTETLKRSVIDHSQGKAAHIARVEQTVSREQLWRAQTPQMFKLGTLKQALQVSAQQGVSVTDEASAIEAMGLRPRLIAGRADNLKVTLPEDLALAEKILATRTV